MLPEQCRVAFTHIVVSDLRVAFSEQLQAGRKALHETATPVVTDGCAPHGAGGAQEQQDGEQRAGSHSEDLLEKDSEDGWRISEVHTLELILILIYS